MKIKEYLFYTQKEVKQFAEEIELVPYYVSNLVNGKRKISKKSARRIEDATNGLIKAEEIAGTFQEPVTLNDYYKRRAKK